MRLVLFSERLSAPFDEGIKNVAVHLGLGLREQHDVLVLTSGGSRDDVLGIENRDVNRALLHTGLARRIREYHADAVLYVPTACATVFSMARARVLRAYARGAPTALITLQPRRYSFWGHQLIGRLAPDWVVSQSAHTATVLRQIGCHTVVMPPAVDANRFRPLQQLGKESLRRQYGLPVEAKIVTHVGHLNATRNLSEFLTLQRAEGIQCLVAASTSTRRDAALREQLRHAGIVVIDDYVPSIEQLYQLSDVYCFLAEKPTAAIELPMSVLEAMSCNLSVVSTPFGALPGVFSGGRGLYWSDGRQPLIELVRRALSERAATRALVEGCTWEAAGATLTHALGAKL